MKFRKVEDFATLIGQLQSFYLFNHVFEERLQTMLEKAQMVTLDGNEYLFKRGANHTIEVCMYSLTARWSFIPRVATV